MKVVKFGGSFLADAHQFKKVKDIILSDEQRKVIVVSAPGKRFKSDNKITDLLYLCHAHVKYGVSYDTIFNTIKERFEEINETLGLGVDLDKEFKTIKDNISKDNLDYIVSRGEYLSALLLSKYLGYDFIDARDFISFKYDGSIDFEMTKTRFDSLKLKHQTMVVPGFYGLGVSGRIKIMSRGGSDITGSILADLLDAEIYENFSDVSGILSADPSIIKNPKSIPIITYAELRELSYLGAKVLHEEAIFPVKAKNIPINILNTNHPEDKGTMILHDTYEYDMTHEVSMITGISGKKDFISITVYKSGSSAMVGVIKKALEILEEYKVSVENMPCGIDSFSLIVSKDSVNDILYEMVDEIKKALDTKSVSISEPIALIGIVGRAMVNSPGISGKIFGELGNHNINIETISQGADELNIMVGVKNEDFEKTISVIYERFIR